MRINSVADPGTGTDAGYAAGLSAAVSVAVDFGIAGVESRDVELRSPPPELCVQARHAARAGVSLDTVLRRYFAGYTLLGDFLVQAAEQISLGAGDLQRVLRDHASLFDRLIDVITQEYNRESEGGHRTLLQRRADRVKRLLAGDLVEVAELDYDLDAWHVGAIAVGPGSVQALRRIATSLDQRALIVDAGEGAIWAWFGSGQRLVPERLASLRMDWLPAEVSLVLGEPGHGLAGWRLTHQQVDTALPIALAGPGRLVRYADVALLASVLRDDVLCRSLEEIYLAPLACGRDGGEALRQTLRAYFAANRNAASAAAALGVSRQTVNNRIHAVEERIGRPLDSCATALETALGLTDLRGPQLYPTARAVAFDASA